MFESVENPPSFRGGIEALMGFLADNIMYPEDAQIAGIQGEVICQFVVGKDGSINNIHVIQSASKSLDAEAVRILSKMPKWNPGTQCGEKVNVKYDVPITFRLRSKTKGATCTKK